jgi:hypothetical protein
MSQTHPDFFLLSNSPLKKEGKTPLWKNMEQMLSSDIWKGFKLGNLKENEKQYAPHASKLLIYTNISLDVGILNGMFQRGLSLITKPKPTREGKGFEWGLRTPPCHFKLKLQKFDNVFGDKSSLGMKIRPHMQNKGHHIGEGLHSNF